MQRQYACPRIQSEADSFSCREEGRLDLEWPSFLVFISSSNTLHIPSLAARVGSVQRSKRPRGPRILVQDTAPYILEPFVDAGNSTGGAAALVRSRNKLQGRCEPCRAVDWLLTDDTRSGRNKIRRDGAEKLEAFVCCMIWRKGPRSHPCNSRVPEGFGRCARLLPKLPEQQPGRAKPYSRCVATYERSICSSSAVIAACSWLSDRE